MVVVNASNEFKDEMKVRYMPEKESKTMLHVSCKPTKKNQTPKQHEGMIKLIV